MRRGNGQYTRGQTRYQPLVDHLAASSKQVIALSYPEIEAIIGAPLSDTALGSGAIWTGRHLIYVQRWRALGWSARIDRPNRRVVFTREEGE